MTILKFQPTKECAFLRINIALDVQERMERYRILCGGLDLTGLVEHTLVNVVDKAANCRGARRGRRHASERRTAVAFWVGFPRR